MENRFTLKDAVLVLLLVVVIAMLGLKMLQDDRQWDQFARLQQSISEQTKDLAAMRRLLREGVAVRPGAGSVATSNAEQGDIFAGLREAQQSPDYATGDWMVEAFGAAVPKLNELTSQDVYSRVVYCRVMESLGTVDLHTCQLTPLLAESWEVAEDGLSVTFHLRENVTFSNGDPLTADDVVYSFQLNKNPEIVDGRNLEYLRHLTACEKIDDYTVRITFEKVFYENLLRAAEIMIHSKEFMSKYSDREIRENPALLLGTGPYRLPSPTTYTPGQQITAVRNERYWGEPAPWDGIVWKIIEKESTEQIAFENGEIDVFGPMPEQHVQMLKNRDLLDRTQHYVFEQVRSGYNYIAWNQRRGGEPTIFADKRVRQAMAMLIDRQRIADEVFLGFSTVANGPFSPLGPQANPDVKPWPYDPERAIALLNEVGFQRDSQSIMLRPDGQPFEIRLTYPAGSDTYQRVMLAVKDNFARAGINVKLDPQEWSLLLKTLTEKTFEAIMLGWGAGGIEGDIEQMFHTRTIDEGDNRNAYSNPELDTLIEKAHVTLDENERMVLWQRCHAILHEDQPYTFMFRTKARLWLDGRIKNVRMIPVLGMNYVSTWPVPIEWYVPQAMQKRTDVGEAGAKAD